MKLILFDCDGTLVDSQVMITTAMGAAFSAHGLPAPTRAATLSVVGLSLPIAIARLLAGQGDVEAVAASYRQAFFDLREGPGPQEPLYEGVAETLADLAGRPEVVMGIVTGKSRRGVEAILHHHGLAQHFHVIKTADDAPSKPHPGMVLDAMDLMGMASRDTVVVGDTSFDMEMAAAAGARRLGVGWGYHSRPALAEAGAELIVEAFQDIPVALRRFWTGAW